MATYLPNTTDFDANTGPKGVIADARSFETARKRSFRQTLYAFANGEAPQIFKREKSIDNKKSQSKSPSPSPSDLSDSEDEFMRTWRAGRLAQMETMNQEMRNTRRQSPSKRRYGSLLTVDPAGYLDAIEKVGAETVVVVLIYDDEVGLFLPYLPRTLSVALILPLAFLRLFDSCTTSSNEPSIAVSHFQHRGRCPVRPRPQAPDHTFRQATLP